MATNPSMHVFLHTSSVITSETYLYVALPNMFNLHPAARIATPSELSTPTLDSLFFSTLILQLLFRTIRTEKVNELWFNVQGYLMRFGLQEYAAMTRLRCGVFPKGDDFDRLIERKRLKERVGYKRLLHGFRGNFERKFQKAKRRKEKEITCTVHGFPIAMQVWAFEAIPEIGERFGQRVGERLPRILRWSARKQPQHRRYDGFFKNVQLHEYATLRPTDAEAEQPDLSSLVPYDDPPVPVLDAFGVGGQSGGQDLEDRVRSGRSGDGETSGDDESDGESGSDREGDDSEDTGDSSTPPGTPIRSPVRGHVHGRGTDPLPTPIEMGVDTGRSQPPVGAYSPPCTDKGELLVRTEDLPEGADIASCPDVEHEPLPTPIDDQEDGAATEPSDAAAVTDAEINGCNVTDGEGNVATVSVPADDVPVPAPVPEGGGRVSTTRRRSARLRRPAPKTRTPYTRERRKTLKK
ncbi:Hypothetical predicted protein [Olea europaea subsp. europaea]|uniref:DUF1985 domain-containing protein n=1 Tax=Olea europaea subsp. europaea TaxID=158383 RepID=A0A8S0TZV6_OLEEU|nr:Hypothetical predicted protein [Olea europaea subsp. europaea]